MAAGDWWSVWCGEAWCVGILDVVDGAMTKNSLRPPITFPYRYLYSSHSVGALLQMPEQLRNCDDSRACVAMSKSPGTTLTSRQPLNQRSPETFW
ncbi:hypothetical protein SNOG_00717 [Parastagonospora nodorum SN15]|uniref:Uncharacterized protein n=1 Tax=Phaeosphaeria nodorum (strain SN15 / ATCC MYA-4574 / FGSC 10173) TaxID=321614 RepID=Q0V5J7_PHANO|nr:hypothetical protein SNOG_00717 [Parastagonospora nodorum SN15]EAT92212.1 hypothetical protein SNOG_00717 [Parastagonospora nodorum SN15]